jgi:DNA repair protein RadD
MATAFDLFGTRSAPKPLRGYQSATIAATKRSVLAGKDRIVVKLPTGAGKTRTAAEIISGALAKGKRVAFTVPAISLVEQTVAAFEAEGIDAIGVMQASHVRTNRAMPVQVVSVQTLARRQRPEADVVIVDECHVQHRPVLEWMADRDSRRVFIGLSATPWARGMADHWNDLVMPVSMQELIDAGYLSPFRVYAPSSPDLSGVKLVAGDYHEGQLADVMGGAQLVADVVETWKARAQGLPTLVFAVDRAHAAKLVQQFADGGVRMGYCDANVDVIERQYLFAQMARGEIAGIVNIGTLTTGVDADVRCVVLARPTKSEMLFVQMIGRGLRTAPGKAEALILDHADNHARMGFVTEIHHDRLLSGREKAHATKADKGEATPKPCPSCGTLKKGGACPSCGFKPERQSEIECEAGELVEFQARAPKHDRAEKQRFWSMAQHVDAARGKGGKLAKALYRGKFGVWPQGLDSMPVAPDPAFLSYERSRRIAYAKGKGAGR